MAAGPVRELMQEGCPADDLVPASPRLEVDSMRPREAIRFVAERCEGPTDSGEASHSIATGTYTGATTASSCFRRCIYTGAPWLCLYVPSLNRSDTPSATA